MNEELLYRLALTFVKNIGPITGRALLNKYGSATAVFNAPLKELKLVAGMGEVRAKGFRDAEVMQRAEKELTYISDQHIEAVWINDEQYPDKLKVCIDAPLLMYYKGNCELNGKKVVAVVGTRKNTEYGIKLTEALIEDLSNQQDIVITSGLADGIDTVAHKAALQNGIPTIGVLGHGHDRMYPVNNRSLAQQMYEQGGVLTEFSSGTIPDRENFPMRNRIVAGMSDVTVVIESDIKGGALITARIASSYNRDVAAYPGRVQDKRSSGCNELIRTNVAAMITKAGDLLELMNWGKPKEKAVQKQLFINLSPEEKVLMDYLATKDAVHADELYHSTGLNNSQLAATLLQLEMQDLVKALPGKMYRLS